MANNLGGTYSTGTITIAAGGVAVTGTGTAWYMIAEVGDWILCNGQVGLVLTVTDNTHLTLQTPWQGTLPSGATYALIKMSWLRYEPALTQAKLRELLAELEGAGNFVFTAVDPPDPAIGQDGDWALKTDVYPWQVWFKTGGVWVEQLPPTAAIGPSSVEPSHLNADTSGEQLAFRDRLNFASRAGDTMAGGLKFANTTSVGPAAIYANSNTMIYAGGASGTQWNNSVNTAGLMMLSDLGALVIVPQTPATQGLYIVHNGVGTYTAPDSNDIAYNYIRTDDEIIQPPDPVGSAYSLKVTMYPTAVSKGSKVGIKGEVVAVTPVDVNGGDLIGVQGAGYAAVNAGGTAAVRKGRIYALGGASILNAGATHWQAMVGLECNMVLLAGASCDYRWGLSVDSNGVGQAAMTDAALAIWLTPPSPGWKSGIEFWDGAVSGGSNPPLDIAGNMILARGTHTIGSCISAPSYTFTNKIFDFANFSVSGNGAITASGLNILNHGIFFGSEASSIAMQARSRPENDAMILNFANNDASASWANVVVTPTALRLESPVVEVPKNMYAAGNSSVIPGYANISTISVGFTNPGAVGMATRPSTDSGAAAAIFENAAGSPVGSIVTSATATTYNTSSDAQLKEDLKSFDAGNIIDDTQVYDFKWKGTDERAYGIIAQQAVEIYATPITHDVMSDRWFVDYSKYVPVLLQELKALRARVAELEGKVEVGMQPT